MEPIKKTTKGGHVIAVRQVTGVERRAYRRKALDLEDKEGLSTADQIDQLEDSLFQIFIESVDGKTEDIVGEILKLPAPDYSEAVDFCKEMLSGLEKKSEGT